MPPRTSSNEPPARFPHVLVALKKAGAPFHLHLYATGSKRRVNSGNDEPVHSGQVEMKSIKSGGGDAAEVEYDGSTSLVITDGSSSATARVQVQDGRPDVAGLFRQIATGRKDGNRGGVIACGPAALVLSARECGIDYGYHVHEESFLL
jgi:hypothetical protein